jgi:hypothetical protein
MADMVIENDHGSPELSMADLQRQPKGWLYQALRQK